MIGVSAEAGLVWLNLGKTPRKEFRLAPDVAHRLAESLEAAAGVAELQERGPPLGQSWQLAARSYDGSVFVVVDRVTRRVPIPPVHAEFFAAQVRGKAEQAEKNTEILLAKGK